MHFVGPWRESLSSRSSGAAPGSGDSGAGWTSAEQTDEDPYGLEDRSARAVLQDLSRRGAQSGVFFFGSWNNLRTLESDLGSFGSGASLHLTLDLGLEDLRSLVGPAVQRVEGSPRIGVFDRAAGDRLEVLIPYSPLGVPQGTVIS